MSLMDAYLFGMSISEQPFLVPPFFELHILEQAFFHVDHYGANIPNIKRL